LVGLLVIKLRIIQIFQNNVNNILYELNTKLTSSSIITGLGKKLDEAQRLW
jgi:hypothetical protein